MTEFDSVYILLMQKKEGVTKEAKIYFSRKQIFDIMHVSYFLKINISLLLLCEMGALPQIYTC